MSPRRSDGPPNTSPKNSRNVPTAAKNGANDGPGMWTSAGGTGLTLAGRIRVGPASAQATATRTKNATTTTAMKTGSSEMSEPQSGMTNCEVNSRIAFQICSIGWVVARRLVGRSRR